MRKIFYISFIFLLLLGCDVVETPTNFHDNPYDTGNPEYKSPIVNIVSGPENGEIINTDEITITWEGANNAEEYRYQFDNSNWSSWLDICLKTFKYLDDKEYIFKVQARVKDSPNKISKVDSVKFTIDAIIGPAIFFYPKCKEIELSENFSVDIFANEIEHLSIFKLIIDYDSGLILNSININDEFLKQNGGNVIKFKEIYNENGIAKINIGVTASENPEINGSGKIATLQFDNNNSIDKNIKFDQDSETRDKNNKPIQMNFNEKCKILIK